MYYNGLGFREIERLTGISHNTIINWVRQAELSPNDSEVNEIKEDTKPDERRECFKSSPCYQRAVFV
jgi:transposase